MARVFLLLMIFALPASAADDLKVSVLEQDVRDLKRQVQTLTQQLNEMRNRPSSPLPQSPQRSDSPPSADMPQWVDASKWRKLHRGMSELEVIGSLGSPTSMRQENGDRILLYAMEIGAGGFLGGSVSFRDRAVAEIRQPTLQ